MQHHLRSLQVQIFVKLKANSNAYDLLDKKYFHEQNFLPIIYNCFFSMQSHQPCFIGMFSASRIRSYSSMKTSVF